MSDNTFSRRELFRRGVFVGAAVAGSSLIMAGCGSKKQPLSCTDVSGLSAGDLTTRKSLQYVDKTPTVGKECDKCRFYQPKAPNQCGACQIVKGPINPGGYCKSWTVKPA